MEFELGNIMDGRPFCIGKFISEGADFVTFDRNKKCWGGKFNSFTNEFILEFLGNDTPILYESIDNIPSLIGNFYKGSKTQVLIYSNKSMTWWLGTASLPGMKWTSISSNFQKRELISILKNKSYWIGDFNGDGKSEILIYFTDYKDNHWWMGEIINDELKWNPLEYTSFEFNLDSRCFTGMFLNNNIQLLYYSTENKNWYLCDFNNHKMEWVQLENSFDKGYEIDFTGNLFLTGNFTDLKRTQIYCIDSDNGNEWVGTVDKGKLWWIHIGNFRYGSISNDSKQWYVGNFDGSSKSQILMVDNKEALHIRLFEGENNVWRDLVWENNYNYPELIYDMNIPNMCKNLYVGNYITTDSKKPYLLSYSESSGNIWIGSLAFQNCRNWKGEPYFLCSISWQLKMNTSFRKDSMLKHYEKNKEFLGLPLTNIASIPDSEGRTLWQFENGVIQHEGSDVYAIYGEIYKKWIEYRDELGNPLSDQKVDKDIISQNFTKGVIYKIECGEYTVVLKNGLALPLIPYRLNLDSVRCISETSGIGEDDFIITLNCSSSTTSRLSGIKSIKVRHQDRDFHTGAHHDVRKLLFEGTLPDAMTVSLMALEVDGEGSASEACDKFDSAVQNYDKTIAYDADTFENADLWATLIGGLGGAGIGAIVGGPPVVLMINGMAIFTIADATLAGAIAGLGIGAAIGLVVGSIIAGILVFLPPDLLAIDRITYIGSELRKIINTEKISGKYIYETNYKIKENQITRRFFWDESVSTWFECRNYKTNESEYELKFGHYLGNYALNVTDHKIDNVGISYSPVLAVYKDSLYCVHQGYNNCQELWYTAFDGKEWASDKRVEGVGITGSPALAVYNGNLYCVYQGWNNCGELWYTVFDGEKWVSDKRIEGIGLSSSPTLAVYNNKLYCAYRAGKYNELWYTVFDGEKWSRDRKVAGIGFSNSPALAVYNDKLYCAYTAGDQELWWTSFNGREWNIEENRVDKRVNSFEITDSPALAVYNGKLYCAFRGSESWKMLWYNYFDGNNWASDTGTKGIYISGTPSLAVFNNRLYCAYQGANSNGELKYMCLL